MTSVDNYWEFAMSREKELQIDARLTLCPRASGCLRRDLHTKDFCPASMFEALDIPEL